MKSYDKDLQTRLTKHLGATGLSAARFAREADTDSGTISKWRSSKYPGDVAALEDSIRQTIDWTERRRESDTKVFSTTTMDDWNLYAGHIIDTNGVGLLYGPAGVGKTISATKFARENRAALHLFLVQGGGGSAALCRALFRQLETRGYRSSKSSRLEWIIDKLKGSNRPLIIDNCQRLTRTGINLILDIHDQTGTAKRPDLGIPIVLTGNDDILVPIRRVGQHSRRIGICRDIDLEKGTSSAADKMVKFLAPDHVKPIRSLARQVAGEKGRLGTLGETLRLMNRLLETGRFDDAADAFRAAHSNLLTDYEL